MKSLFSPIRAGAAPGLLALGLVALSLAGCEEPARPEVDTTVPPYETTEAPSAIDETAPVTDPTAPTDTVPTTPLPTDEKTSEQSVQPESETLFY